MTLVIGPTPATVRTLRDLRRATSVLNRELAFHLTRAAADQRDALLERWRDELRTVHPATARGVRWVRAAPGRTMQAQVFITRRVWDRYMQIQIQGGRRRYRRGFVIYFPGVSRAERRRFDDPARFELPIQGSRNRLVLTRTGGRSRVIGIRVFEASYRPRASGGDYVRRTLPGLVELRIGQAFERHSRRAG